MSGRQGEAIEISVKGLGAVRTIWPFERKLIPWMEWNSHRSSAGPPLILRRSLPFSTDDEINSFGRKDFLIHISQDEDLP